MAFGFVRSRCVLCLDFALHLSEGHGFSRAVSFEYYPLQRLRVVSRFGNKDSSRVE
jgi:hypothetical protein